jgi:hypothetical protein
MDQRPKTVTGTSERCYVKNTYFKSKVGVGVEIIPL